MYVLALVCTDCAAGQNLHICLIEWLALQQRLLRVGGSPSALDCLWHQQTLLLLAGIYGPGRSALDAVQQQVFDAVVTCLQCYPADNAQYLLLHNQFQRSVLRH